MTPSPSAERFPSYTYVPGRSPHPVTNPRGHAFGRPAPVAAPLDPLRYRACHEYLRGIDLFNAGYYWEAHEAWEAVWLAVSRAGPVADFLKGLIKLAAAGVKAYEGRPEGVRRHARRAAELLSPTAAVTAEGKFAGLDRRQLVSLALQWTDAPETLIQRVEQPPCAALLTTLQPD